MKKVNKGIGIYLIVTLVLFYLISGNWWILLNIILFTTIITLIGGYFCTKYPNKYSGIIKEATPNG